MRELPAVMAVVVEFEHEARALIAGEITAAPKKADQKVWLGVLHAQTKWFDWLRERLPHESYLPKLEARAVLGWIQQTEPHFRQELRQTAMEFKTDKRTDALQILDRTAEVVVTLGLVCDAVQSSITSAAIVEKSVDFLKNEKSKKEVING
jgi:hypothetical protein